MNKYLIISLLTTLSMQSLNALQPYTDIYPQHVIYSSQPSSFELAFEGTVDSAIAVLNAFCAYQCFNSLHYKRPLALPFTNTALNTTATGVIGVATSILTLWSSYLAVKHFYAAYKVHRYKKQLSPFKLA